ncbi:MAG: hypothetical protein ONB05_04820, partial [candidate division KSB1 bacterium]|nr:hypothetical protein [candidate division KSB1 bacterium]
ITMLLGCILFLVTHCNIFDWTATSPDEAFYKGIELFNQKKFTEAKEKFAEALKSDPYRSDYRYYHAKAVVFESNLNFFAIARRIVEIDTTTVTGLKLPLYTQEPDMTLAQDIEYKNSIYQVTWVSHEDISPIYFGKTHGGIAATDITFEFSILSLARAILQLRDTNNNKAIESTDLYITITKNYNEQLGRYYYQPNLEEITEYLKNADNRGSFNEMLQNSVIYAVEGLASLANVVADTTLFNNQDLENLTQKIKDVGNLYQIGDGKDNDKDGR